MTKIGDYLLNSNELAPFFFVNGIDRYSSEETMKSASFEAPKFQLVIPNSSLVINRSEATKFQLVIRNSSLVINRSEATKCQLVISN